MEKKTYEKNQIIVSGKGNSEKILFVLDSDEVIYIPENSKEYFFDETKEVYEITFDKNKGNKLEDSVVKPMNQASPFSLTGDACFYNFMARKININNKIRMFNKKGKDCLWLLSGSLHINVGEEKIGLSRNIPLILDKKNSEYEIIGKGVVFLIKF